MAFDKEGFREWLSTFSYKSAPEQYPYYLQILEDQYQWDTDSLSLEEFAVADARLSQEIDSRKQAGVYDKKDTNNLASYLSAFRSYREYLLQRDKQNA
ncbi:hypothetical protein [Hymenobacter mucosus]|uniref:Uncharacterized protein n=1 Tax=Hymenobacter mucosus TaxID=1411120 RepID=A0A239ASC1_9BACT|nr:hypothetical protein [Hymenobacter mucosus]SNR98440.1 hypothetical protein SAMN06269173_11510 [Hymenobacter mucosus]